MNQNLDMKDDLAALFLFHMLAPGADKLTFDKSFHPIPVPTSHALSPKGEMHMDASYGTSKYQQWQKVTQ